MSSSSKNSFRSRGFAIVQRTVTIYCFPSEDLNTRKAVQIRSRKWTCDCGEERDTGADHRSLVAKNGSGTGLRRADQRKEARCDLDPAAPAEPIDEELVERLRRLHNGTNRLRQQSEDHYALRA